MAGLTPHHVRSLATGQMTHIEPENMRGHHELHLTTAQMRKFENGYKSGRGARIKFSRGQVNHHRKHKLSGGGFVEVLKQFGPTALTGLKSLFGSKAAQAGIAGLAASGAAAAVHRLGASGRLKEAEQLARIAEESAERRVNALKGLNVPRSNMGDGIKRHRGKGFSDVINRGLDIFSNPFGELAGLAGLGVKKRKAPKRGGNIFKDLGGSSLGQALAGPIGKAALFGLGVKKRAPKKGKGFLSGIAGIPSGILSSFGLGVKKSSPKKKKGGSIFTDIIGAATNPLYIPLSLARGAFGSNIGLGVKKRGRKPKGSGLFAPGTV